MTKTITKRRGLTVFRTLASTVILLLLLGTNALKAQTYFTEGFEGTWYLNGNSATAATAAGPNAPSTWTQTRVLNNVVPGACAGAPHDWGQMLWGTSYTAVNFAGTSTSGCAPYGGAPTLPPQGSNVLWFYDGNTFTGNTRRIESPAIDLSTSTSPVVSFSFSYAGSGTACTFVGSNDGGLTWNTISALATTTSGVWATRVIAIPPGYNVANAKFGFQMAATYGSSDVFIDNLVVREGTAPTSAPISLTTTIVTTTSMTLGWTDNSTDETGFRVFRSTDNVNFTQIGTNITSTTVAGIGTTYTSAQTGLTPGTTYYYRVAAYLEGNAISSLATQATLNPTTYYWVGSASGTWNAAANWNTDPAGTGSTRSVVATTDVMIVDGAGTTPGGSVSISVDATSFSIGQFKVTSNTTLSLVSSATTTRAITVTGCPGADFVIESGSTLTTTSTTNAVSFAFSGTGNTGDISGTYNLGGSTSNTFSSTGGTGTLVTIGSTGVINNGTVGTGSYFTGSVATMSFAAGSAYNVNGATTGVTVPLATWATTSTLTFNSITSATGFTNNAQSFGNVTYNCTNASATMSAWTTGTVAVIKGNLTINATNTGRFRALTSGNISINGNLNVNGGTFEVASTTGILNVLGNVNIAGGTFDIAQGSSSFLRVSGNFVQTGGSIIQTSATGTLEFNGTSASTLTLVTGSHGTNAVSIRINNAAGVNLTSAYSARNVIITRGGISGTGSIVYNGSSSVLTYNGSTGAQTATSFELPATGGPSSLTINNTSTSPANVVTIPYSTTLNGTAGVLTLTSGLLDNSGYVLTLSNTAVGAISGGSATSYVKGAIARSIPANYATASNYTFPVGKGSLNAFELVNPKTNTGGSVTVQAEVFDANAGGTAGTLMGTLNTNRYWAASITSGAANFTDALIKLNDAPAGADAIAASATLTGAYDIVGGVSITSTSTSLTTTAPAATNIVGFYCMGNKAAATLSALAITPAGNLCTNVLRTVTVTATPGGGAVTGVALNYSVNGVAQTAIAMTNTSGNDWSGDIPTVTPANATVTWSVTATDANSLTKSATGTSYNDEPLFSSSASISSSVSTICVGSSATLTANFVSAGGTATVGAGATNSSGTAASFFPGFWGGAKTQFIVRASELTAAGLRAGNITNIGYVPTVVGQTYQGFQMLVGHTTQTTTTATYVPNASLTKVYEGTLTNSGILPVANVVNNLTFGTGTGSASSFNWDGVSNLVISISWSLNPLAGTSNATTMQVDNPGFTCSVYNQADNQTMAAMAAYTTGTTGTTRPKFIFTGIASATPTSVTWNDGSSNFSTSNPVTVSASSTTTYTAAIVASGCTLSTSPSITLNVATPPSAPSTTSAVSCPGLPTASVASTSGYAAPKYKWYSAATAGTTKQNSYATTYSTALTATDTSYVTEIDTVTGCESSPRQQIISKVNALTISAVTPWFCGQGAQTDDLTATSSDINFTSYTWSTTSPGASFNSNVGNPVTANLNATSLFRVAATDGNCTQNADITIGVYDFPTPNFTTAPNDTVCLGTPVTIGTGLVAGAFSSSTIAYSPLTAPVSATNLCSGGTATVALASGGLDDGGWSSIPLGFSFNFFGTPYTTINVGTNGTMMFGTYNANGGFTAPYGLGDYTFTTLPSTGEPFNMLALCANDNNLTSGTIRYWTEGTAPNRKFVIEYFQAPQYFSTGNTTTAQAIFYETIGVIEEHIFNSASTNNKVCGINNGNGTIGALAYASTAAITTPVAYRFSPPSNYSTVWSPSGSLSGTTSGTNIFQATTNITSVGTTSVSLVLTNLTTGCSNAASPSTIDIVTIAKPVDPITAGNTVCGQGSALLTISNAASLNATDTIKWYNDSIGGSPIAWGASYTTPNLTSTKTYYVETYNGFCVNNSGRVPVTLTVTTPDPIVASASVAQAACLGNSFDISVSQASSNNSYSLNWTSSDSINSGLTASTGTSLNNPLTLTPAATGTYVYTVSGTESSTGCSVNSQVTVSVIAPFVGKTISVNPSTFCANTPTTLTFTSALLTGTPSYTPPPAVTSPLFDEDISNITITSGATTILNNSSLNNDLVGSIGTATGTAGGFSDFTSFGPYSLTPGSTCNFSISSSDQGFAYFHGFGIFIDFNRDGDFNDAGEMVYSSPNTTSGAHTETGSFTVPSNAKIGATRMRIGTTEALLTSPTQNIFYGEWEEYTMNITGSASFTWNDGTTNVGTTNPVVVSPSASTTYTVSMNVMGCTDTAMVVVNPTAIPSDPTTSPSAHCGNQIPTCSASGANNGDYRWYTDIIGGTALAGETNSTLGSYYVGTTTTLYVSISNGTCESARIPVVITVTTPNPIVASSTKTTNVCANSTIDLSVSQALTNNSYSLTWTANSYTGSGLSSSTAGALNTPLTISPTAAGNYVYTISGVETSTGCVTSSNVNINVVDPYNGLTRSASANPSTVCAGSPTTLTLLAGNAGTTSGTATTTEFGGSVYRTGAGTGDFRHQLVFTAAELNALGLGSGDITAIAFDVTAAGTGSTNNYTISLGTASSSTLSTTFDAATLTQVYTAATYQPVFGSNVHTFNTPYNWNGTSDLLINICYNVSTFGGSSTVAATTPSNVSNVSLLANIGACTNTTGTATYANRPFVTFSGIVGPAFNSLSWSNGTSVIGSTNPQVANPTVNTTYKVVMNILGCLDSTTVAVSTNPLPIATNAPTTVSTTSNSIDVTWNATSGATGYQLDVATNSNFTSMVSGYNNLSVSSNSQSVTGLSAGTTYYFRVRAVNGCGASSNSSSLTETTVSNVSIYLTAYLQGLYTGAGAMTSSPFNADGVTSSSIADTITVQLYTAGGALAYSSTGALSTAGNALVSFPGGAIGNSYYIVIKHRNSIATSSAATVLILATNTSYDFSSALTQSFGDNAVNDGSGVFMIYTGDINQDGSVDFNDYPNLDIASSGGVLGYDPNDLNGDASVDFNDYPLIDVNSSNGVISILP